MVMIPFSFLSFNKMSQIPDPVQACSKTSKLRPQEALRARQTGPDLKMFF
jgi:hypothetical protein